jgi:phage terminase small subunit
MVTRKKSGPYARLRKPKGAAKDMTPRREMFCYEYVKDFNATQAAIRAGFSAKTAGPAAARLLQDVSVHSLIEKLRAEQIAKTKMTSDEILAELAKLARSDLRNAFREYEGDDGKKRIRMLNPLEMDAEHSAALAGVEVLTSGDDSNQVFLTTKVKHWDKHAALRTLAQIHKLIGADVEINLGAELAQRLAQARKRARGEQK